MILSVGLAVEIFLEITFLNSVKIAEGPVVPKAAYSAFFSFLFVICQRPFDQSQALIWFFQTR